jgi:glucokinase
MTFLVADIGGTNTRLALAEDDDPAPRQIRRYENTDAPGLDAIIAEYLESTGAHLDRACLAVAGPTDGRHARLTNLPWAIDADALGTRFGCNASLINDFAAVGHALGSLAPSVLYSLQEGERDGDAARLALGAGTGLGVVISVPDGAGMRPLPSEGGHIAFAPRDDEQIALLRWLQARHGRASVERILSGPGIVDLYAYCRESMGRPMTRQRTAAEVSAAALAGEDATAVWAMRLFCAIFGQTAGDLALVAGARGGVYLAGGIAAKILPLLDEGRFISGFCAKGRFTEWMLRIPVDVVLDPDIGLRGAALAAARG